MSYNYTVAPGQEFNYPANAQTKTLVEQVGGRRNLSKEQQRMCQFKTVTEGQDCSDMPASTLELFVERGWVLVTEPKIDKSIEEGIFESVEEFSIPELVEDKEGTE